MKPNHHKKPDEPKRKREIYPYEALFLPVGGGYGVPFDLAHTPCKTPPRPPGTHPRTPMRTYIIPDVCNMFAGPEENRQYTALEH